MTRIEQSKSPARGTKEVNQESANVEAVADQPEDFQALMEDVYGACSRYFGKRPAVAAGALFAVGFYIGWKVRP